RYVDADRDSVLAYAPEARLPSGLLVSPEKTPRGEGGIARTTHALIHRVDAERDSVLAYAPEARLASVLLFSQEKTARGEADMARMTHALIDRVIDLGGTLYFPS